MTGADSKRTRVGHSRRTTRDGEDKRVVGGGNRIPVGQRSRELHGTSGGMGMRGGMTRTARDTAIARVGTTRPDAEISGKPCRALLSRHLLAILLTLCLRELWLTRMVTRKIHWMLYPLVYLANATRSATLQTCSSWSPLEKLSSLLRTPSLDETVRLGTVYIGSFHTTRTKESVTLWSGYMTMLTVLVHLGCVYPSYMFSSLLSGLAFALASQISTNA